MIRQNKLFEKFSKNIKRRDDGLFFFYAAYTTRAGVSRKSQKKLKKVKIFLKKC